MSERGRWMRDVREMGERCEGDEWEMWGTWVRDVRECVRDVKEMSERCEGDGWEMWGRWVRDVREMGERCEGDEWEMSERLVRDVKEIQDILTNMVLYRSPHTVIPCGFSLFDPWWRTECCCWCSGQEVTWSNLHDYNIIVSNQLLKNHMFCCM